MTINKTTLEVIAPTIEEAVDKGLSELGLTEEDVEVEILDEGKRNLFRFASRQARIRLTVKNPAAAIGGSTSMPVASQAESFKVASPAEAAVKVVVAVSPDATIADELEDEQLIVKETLLEILTKMGVKAKVNISSLESEAGEKPVILANIEGEDLSFLIGRKSETLNALQYILSLMVSHKIDHWIPIQVDVQNYRARRENELKKLARRMADQVIATGRKQYFEPMPANERRIIHMELRNNDRVQTESVGEEPNRKVSIFLSR
ncbi:MAG: RNA-binding cell elongation regulator Jag/EloR [Anaerolineaceae bacterium]